VYTQINSRVDFDDEKINFFIQQVYASPVDALGKLIHLYEVVKFNSKRSIQLILEKGTKGERPTLRGSSQGTNF